MKKEMEELGKILEYAKAKEELDKRGYEIVVRNDGVVYVRRKPKRDFYSSSPARKKVMLRFALGAVKARGKTYEEVIETIRNEMKKHIPERKVREIEMTESQLQDLYFQMLRRGIMNLPLNVKIKVVEDEEKIKRKKKIREAIRELASRRA